MPVRLPGLVAFAEVYPLDALREAGPPPARPAFAARATPHVAVASRRACPGRRCPEMPQRWPPIRSPPPMRRPRSRPRTRLLPQPALPFAASVVETLAPAARVVGDAAEPRAHGAAAVQGSVALAVADCLR